jgi:hypothetical protein
VPIALAYATGAMEIPRIDDWAFARVAADLYSTGHFRLVGWGEMTMIGHELWGLPFIALFGRSITVLHWAGAVAAALGLIGTFLLYRQFVTARMAVLGTAAIAVVPAFAVLSTTYMTDLTSYAGEVICLTLGVAALRSEGRRSALLLAAAVVVGFWAFTCRELSLAAPLAVLIGYLVRERRQARSLRLPGGLVLGLLVAAAALYVWRKHLPGDQATPIVRPGLQTAGHSLLVLADTYFAVALGLLPILLLCARGAIASIREAHGARWVALGAVLAGLLLLAIPHYPNHDPTTVLDGNILSRYGTGGPQATAFGARSPLFPDGLWFVINLVAVGAGTTLAGALWGAVPWRRVRERRLSLPRPELAAVLAYAALTAALLAFRALERGFLIDRYFVTLTAALGLVALLALRERARLSIGAGTGGLALVALLAVLVVLDADNYDTTRWEAAKRAVAQGVPSTGVSAGFEWTGAHHPGVIPESENILGYPDRCVLVAAAPAEGMGRQLIAVRDYGPIDGVLTRHLWIYREPQLCKNAS